MTQLFNVEDFNKFDRLLRDCGEFMLSAHLLESNSNNIKKKSGDADLVTVFDEGVQNKLIDGILEIFPDAHFFAEEKENFEEDTKNGLCFVIDPIDGTTNFIHELGTSAISVCILKDGDPVFGAVYDPYRDEMFTAEKGKGAYKNGERIYVSERQLANSVVAFGTTPYKKAEYADKGFDIAKRIFVNCSDIRRSGSAAIDMANVACGRLDAFFECILSPWDFAAGYVLITEAGGTVTDFNGNIVSFSQPSQVLCSNNIVYKKLIALINK